MHTFIACTVCTPPRTSPSTHIPLSHLGLPPHQYDDAGQWLQIELAQVKKITGIVTQGAKALGKEMFISSYSLEHSDDGIVWNQYTDDDDYLSKVKCCSGSLCVRLFTVCVYY